MVKPDNLITRQSDNLKIAFFGTPTLAQIVLEKLIDSPYRPSIVFTGPDSKSGRGQKPKYSPVKQTAIENGIKVLQPKSLNQQSTINNQQFDLAILVAYGKIIPKEILEIPKYGFLNIHPSLLPKYRGPSPIQSTILRGEEKTGVSIILLDKEIDHGPILAQKEMKIKNIDTHETLIEKLAELGAKLLLETLPKYVDRPLKPKPQNHKKATFTTHINKKDGEIDINNPLPKQTFDRMVRAFYPWPGVWTEIETRNKQHETRKLKIKFIPDTKYRIPNTFLIQPEGKRPLTVKQFKNGYPKIYQQLKL